MALTLPDGNYDPNLAVDESLRPALNYTPNRPPGPNGSYGVSRAILGPATPATPNTQAAPSPKKDHFTELEQNIDKMLKSLPEQAQVKFDKMMLEDPSADPRKRKFQLAGQILAGIGDVVATQIGPRMGVAPVVPGYLNQVQNRIDVEQRQFDDQSFNAKSRILENTADQEKQLLGQKLGIQVERAKEGITQSREATASQIRAAGDLMDIIQKGGDVSQNLISLAKQIAPEGLPEGVTIDKGDALNALATAKDPDTGKFKFLGDIDPTTRTFIIMGLSASVKSGNLGGKDALLKLFTNPTYISQLVANGKTPSEEYGRIMYGLNMADYPNRQAYILALSEKASGNGDLNIIRQLESVPADIPLPPTSSPDIATLQGADSASVGKVEMNKDLAFKAAGTMMDSLTKQFPRVAATVPEAFDRLDLIRTSQTPDEVSTNAKAYAKWAAEQERKIEMTDQRNRTLRENLFPSAKTKIFTPFLSGKITELGRGNGPIKASDLRGFIEDTVNQTMAPLAGFQDLEDYRTLKTSLWEEAKAALRNSINPKRIVDDLKMDK
jgi:hypothetical protein